MKNQGADLVGDRRAAAAMLQDVNVVSAPIIAKERGVVVEETTREAPETMKA